jgi:hypothetical protein
MPHNSGAFCRRQLDVRCLWFPYRSANHLHTLFPLKHPDMEYVFGTGQQMRITQGKIGWAAEIAFTVCWREGTSRADNNLSFVLRKTNILSLWP